ncbi:MAG: cytochrome c3 family protein [Sulfurimicrobium sp.]|nr:cytochrome c3 family protein [Sulfurimicrobium sp.]MDO9190025.1 cytochrome c3 family protein [Sulfurimicrobium sp.]MDP1703075.1 cytochrome c3 family protein [Sulfurimicrobium sp.]MDP3688017.1 cytochrome c3 family protein [Sulfurimicrobium sp.]MDZ7655892.1 c(7)-type cytochrome triheme domain-containing protein [Sulfurimicrobium sp.]
MKHCRWRYTVRFAPLAILLGLAGMPCLSHSADEVKLDDGFSANLDWDPSTRSDCKAALRSNCNAPQEDFIRALRRDFNLSQIISSANLPAPPALAALPRDKNGIVHWVKAVAEGMIKPRDDIYGPKSTNVADSFVRAGLVESKDDFTGLLGGLDSEHFKRLIVMQVKNHFMADVLFPHGMHTYWVNCSSCHPKPFVPKIGANDIKMKAILEGEYCGKCHGKVAFPIVSFENCVRCHVVSKKTGF